MHRRRLLTGLSAASVAAALPRFAFGATALADDGEGIQLVARLQRGRRSEEGRHYRLYLTAPATITLRQRFEVHDSSHLLYANGSRGELYTHVAPVHLPARELIRRRAPPPLPDITLQGGRELRVATLSLRARIPRELRAEAHIEMSFAGHRLVLPPTPIMA